MRRGARRLLLLISSSSSRPPRFRTRNLDAGINLEQPPLADVTHSRVPRFCLSFVSRITRGSRSSAKRRYGETRKSRAVVREWARDSGNSEGPVRPLRDRRGIRRIRRTPGESRSELISAAVGCAPVSGFEHAPPRYSRCLCVVDVESLAGSSHE